jgi:hypothetical protein
MKKTIITSALILGSAVASQATITLISGLSTGTTTDPEISKAGIIVTGDSTNGAEAQHLVNGNTSASFPSGMWYNGNSPATQTLTFDLGGTFTVSSVTVAFAWADRDDMTYTFAANGSDQGSFSVANGSSGAWQAEPTTTFIFDKAFTASSIDLNLTDIAAGGSTNEASPSISEVTFTTVPEPSSAALLGLGGLTLILRRRK